MMSIPKVMHHIDFHENYKRYGTTITALHMGVGAHDVMDCIVGNGAWISLFMFHIALIPWEKGMNLTILCLVSLFNGTSTLCRLFNAKAILREEQ